MDGNTKTILMSPLNWGLGHTVRLVPFIRKAIREDHRVILASDGASLDFLRYHFPQLPWVRMSFYPVRYPENGKFFRKLIPQIPGILCSIRDNHRQVQEIVARYSVTEIICDHRYGLHHKKIPSIFITNQLWLKAPKGWSFGEGLVYRLHLRALKKFTEIWIADYPGEPNLSGQLTHPSRLPSNAKYIGPVSRFPDVTALPPADASAFEVLALVSGPEPQRTIFENLLKEKFLRNGKSAVILRGIPPKEPDESPSLVQEKNILLISHARDEHLLWYMHQAREIICRPGNSTLSDLMYLNRKALLVPTPGQTEQEYVAGHLEEQGGFTVCLQDSL